MHQFIDFVLRHYILCSLFIVLVISLLVYEAIGQGYGSRIIAQELIAKMNANQVAIFDIRDKSAYVKGHIVDSTNVKAEQLNAEDGPLSTLSDKMAVIVCAKGQESGVLVAKIKAASKHKNMALLAGGIAEWTQQGLPLKKGKK